MMPDIALGLAEHFGDFVQCVAFNEVQPKRFLLIFRKRSKHLLQIQFSQPLVE